MLRTKQLYGISLGVAILLVSLILIQIYWVGNTYRLKEASLDEKAGNILKTAAAYIEENSTHFYLYGHSYIAPGEGVMILKTGQQPGTDTVKLFNAFPYHDKPDTCFYTTGISYYDMLTMVDITMRFEYRATDTLLNIREQNRQFNDMTLGNYRHLLDDKKNIAERINTAKLDSVLSALMKAENISLPYVYGLKKKGADEFEYVSDKNKKHLRHLSTSPYHTTLLRNQPLAGTYDIYLHLYDASGYIGRSLLLSLVVSGFIILLLSVSFLYFFRTVLRQRKVSEMKTDFINNMTHEFMTPVSNIALSLETIQKPGTSDADKKRILDIIASENVHLKDNINKVLQIAVLEKGSFFLDPLPVDIHHILKRVADAFDMQLQAKQGTFLLALNAADAIVVADETHIINMFSNVIDNAIKYTNIPVIAIESNTINNKPVVTITDNGHGMSPEIQKKIFDKFYRGSYRNVHDVKGFGLGLSYVKSIAEAHNISVQVKSTPGKGTTFIFQFR